ncbi:MAG: CHAT domain-containing protein, partial [Acidobacteriota bacterium]
AEVQAGLEPGTLLLAYFLGSESGYLWALDRNRFSVHRLPPGAAIEASARRLHDLLSAGHKTGFAAQATLPARALSDSILQPVAARLAQARRLIIIPDGALHYVPFSILPHPRTGERMLASHPITYTGSAAVLDALRMRGASRQAAAKTLLVVADPAFTPGEARAPPATHPAATHSANVAGASMSTLARAARAFDLADVPPLPFSRREAESILNLIPGPQSHALLGPEATAEAIQQAPLRHYRILHIATHGLLNDRQPELSGLILARSPAGDTLQPTLLRVPEIRRLELRAELVVLSACRTALGREILGEGLVGLPQAFLDAGAQRVLVSLWNVHDQATATLMQRFYEHLLRDEIPAQEALRRAQRTVAGMPRWSSPFFWAGFVLIGEP